MGKGDAIVKAAEPELERIIEFSRKFKFIVFGDLLRVFIRVLFDLKKLVGNVLSKKQYLVFFFKLLEMDKRRV